MLDLYSSCRLDDVQSINLSVIKLSRHRHNHSLKSRVSYFKQFLIVYIVWLFQRHYPSSARSRVRNTVHIAIRPKNNTHVTTPEGVDRHYHRDESRKESIGKNLVQDSENTIRCASINKSHRAYPLGSQSNLDIWKNDVSKKNTQLQSHFLARTENDREHGHQTIFKATTGSSKLSKSTSINGSFWNTTGITYVGTGIQGSALNQLSVPVGIFIDSNDILYINDIGNYRCVKYLPGASSGILVAGLGGLGSALNQLGSSIRFNYVDSNQNIYISDGSNNRVMFWANSATTGIKVAGDGTSGTSLNHTAIPFGVWVDSSSNVFVSESGNHRVTRWSPGATVGVVVAGGNGQGTTPDKLSGPYGIFYDETNQNLYIVNALSHIVVKWRVGTANGTVLAGVPGSSGSSSTYLKTPVDLTLDQWNNIYILDRGNSRIQLFCDGNSTGITIAGNGTSGSSLTNPWSIKLDSQLNLYVSDSGTGRILKFSKL
ncbi:unnamed protein product [Adineta steineri]|uniref:NHL repeat containing protein-like protein n=1 Tax=Adineta steineri TaxID=433720 RepID=A0A813U097_9BILA|nr:unnamed protein product [Adineta steineri]